MSDVKPLTDAEVETARHNVHGGAPFGVLSGAGKILTCPSPIWVLLSRLLATISERDKTIAALETNLRDAAARERAITSERDTANGGRMEWFKRAESAEADNVRLREALAGLIKSAEFWESMTERKFFALHESDNFLKAKAISQEPRP